MSTIIEQNSLDLSAQIKPLVHKLGEALHATQGGTIVTFIAARSGEGATTVARSFVQAFNAETGKRILLIEAGPEPKAGGSGIVELAASGADTAAACVAVGAGIHVARWTNTPQGKMISGRVAQDKALWQTLQNNFAVIVIDAPSLQASSEGIAFAQASTFSILVVEAEKTRKEVVENLRDTLTAVNATIAGIVMNSRKFYIPEKYYKRL